MEPVTLRIDNDHEATFVGELIGSTSNTSPQKVNELALYKTEDNEYVCYQYITCYSLPKGVHDFGKIEICSSVDEIRKFFDDGDIRSVNKIIEIFKLQFNADEALAAAAGHVVVNRNNNLRSL